MSAVDLAGHLWLLLAALGLNVAVGYAGLPLLSQGGFVAGGMFGTVLLADQAHWPLLLAAMTAVLLTALAGWLLARGAGRLHGGPFALATWALAWLVYSLLRAFPGMYGGDQGLIRPAPARLVSRFLGVVVVLHPWVHIVIAVLLCLLVGTATWWLGRGPLALDFAAVRGGPTVSAAVGVPFRSRRAAAAAASAAVGAIAGAGLATLAGLASASDVTPLLSLQLYAAVLVGGSASLLGPVFGVAVIVALPSVADALSRAAGVDPIHSRGLLTAVLLLLVLLTPHLRDLVDVKRWIRRGASTRSPVRGADPEVGLGVSAARLELRDMRKAYGATAAVDGISLEVRGGEVHALIGGNGSGKTTTLRLAAGALSLDAGTVALDGERLVGGEDAHVRHGVARTFQQHVLLDGLSVREQVAVGARVGEQDSSGLRLLLATPRARAAARHSTARVDALLRLGGLAGRAADDPETLPYGDQRLLPVLRAAATGARILLLDEPSAGMSQDEIARLREVVTSLVASGVGVLLVEHNMRLVGQLADRVTVLAEGSVIAQGTVAEVRAEPAVRAAFLGTEVLAT